MRKRASKTVSFVGVGVLLLNALLVGASLAASPVRPADQQADLCGQEQVYNPHGDTLPDGEAWESESGDLDSSAYDYCDGEGCGDPVIARVCLEAGDQLACAPDDCFDVSHDDGHWAVAEKWHAASDPEQYKADHECEDATHLEVYYQCSLAEQPTGSITVSKSEANAALPDDWSFEIASPDGFSYPINSGQTVSDLPLGQYNITEIGPDGWHLASVSGEGCALEGQSASASIVSGTENITCTLVNEVDSPSIALEKYVSDDTATWHDADVPPGPYIIEYDPAFWTFVISNTGNVELTTVVVTDTVLGQICTMDSLAAGAAESCTAISLAVEGQQENLGFATAQYGGDTVGDQDPCHYFGVGYLVPTLTPEPPTPTPTPKKSAPPPAPSAPTPVPATPTLIAASPTPTVVVEILGVERLPDTGIEASATGSLQWLTGMASALLASAAALGLLLRRK